MDLVMGLVLVAALAFAMVVHLVRRRRSTFTIAPSEAISTFHVGNRKHTAKTKAALAAATATLR
jgi:hypothetical protein